MADKIIVDALVDKYTDDASTLEGIRDDILAALLARASVNIHIANSSGDFGSASGITLATAAEQRDMLANVNAALAQIAGDDPDISATAAVMDFSSRRAEL